MKKHRIPTDFFIRNRQELAKQLNSGSLALVTANDELTRSGDQNFPYRQNAGFFYLTGIEQEKCILALCPDHPDPALREVLFTVKPNEALETWTGHKLTPDEIREASGIANVKWLDDLEMTMRDLALSSTHVYINLNEYSKYLPDVVYRDQNMVSWMKTHFPLHSYHRLAPLLTRQRMIKSREEIDMQALACEITGKAFRRVLGFVKPGVTEYGIEAEMTHEFIMQGARGHAYQPIIGSGRNGLVLHYVENSDTCREGDLLLMDFGAEVGNYAADCSRTIPVSGTFTPRQRECYDAVLRVQKKAIGLFTPGTTIDEINKEVWKMMEAEMIKLGLFTAEEAKRQDPKKPLYARYLMHGVAHFIGLDVHDVGGKYEKLEKGMILTIEPGLYIKDEKIAIRIEDNILVGDTPVNLMDRIPKEADEIERLMKG